MRYRLSKYSGWFIVDLSNSLKASSLSQLFRTAPQVFVSHVSGKKVFAEQVADVDERPVLQPLGEDFKAGAEISGRLSAGFIFCDLPLSTRTVSAK